MQTVKRYRVDGSRVRSSNSAVYPIRCWNLVSSSRSGQPRCRRFLVVGAEFFVVAFVASFPVKPLMLIFVPALLAPAFVPALPVSMFVPALPPPAFVPPLAVVIVALRVAVPSNVLANAYSRGAQAYPLLVLPRLSAMHVSLVHQRPARGGPVALRPFGSTGT
jgi:hypothetical protein